MEPVSHDRRVSRLEAATGARVGGVAGLLVGGGLLVLTGWPWWIAIAAVAGATAGAIQGRREAARRQ